MYKVNRYKLIGELHRKISKLTVNSYHTLAATDNRNFLNYLPKDISINKVDLKQINSEYSALLKLFSRSFSIPQYAIAKSLSSFILNCQKQNKDQPANKDKEPPHPSFKPDGKYDPPDDEKDPEKEKMMSILR